MQQKQILIAVALAVPVLAALLAALGFRGRDVIVGIDLGTTYSTVAYRLNGNLHVMRNDYNNTITPSVIALHDGEFLVGKAAASILREDPRACVFDSKRLIGRRWDDEVLIAEVQRHNGRLVRHPTARRDLFGKVREGAKLASCKECEPEPAFVVRAGGSKAVLGSAAKHVCLEPRSTMSRAELTQYLQTIDVSAGILEGDAEDASYVLVTPSAAACIIVRGLTAGLSKELGHSQFKSAVITVPAEFNAAQRQATSDAYIRAGITPSRVLHEPAAAAIAYGLHRQSNVRYVLVFDMGGGTLDVSVLYAQKGAFTLLGTGGDAHLGGEDFDDCMLGIIEAQRANGSARIATQQTGLDVDECTEIVLRKEAERVKIAFGAPETNEVQWRCRSPSGVLAGTITRQAFEDTCDALFQRSLQSVADGLESANLPPGSIDEVVLVGGSSRLLKVRALLEGVFAKPLKHTVDPDLAVAVGASMVVD